MKIIYLIFLLILSQCFGQTHKHWFGAHGGVAFSFAGVSLPEQNLSSFIPDPARGMTSYSMELSYTYMRNNSLIVNSDLIFVSKGGYLYSVLLDPNTKVNMAFNTDHLSIPVKVGINVGERYFAQFLFGFSATVFLSSKFIYELNATNHILKPKVKMPFDVGMNAEARTGYCFKDQIRLFLSVNYDRSFLKHQFTLDLPTNQNDIPMTIGYEYASVLVGLSFNIENNWSKLKPKKKFKEPELEEE